MTDHGPDREGGKDDLPVAAAGLLGSVGSRMVLFIAAVRLSGFFNDKERLNSVSRGCSVGSEDGLYFGLQLETCKQEERGICLIKSAV